MLLRFGELWELQDVAVIFLLRSLPLPTFKWSASLSSQSLTQSTIFATNVNVSGHVLEEVKDAKYLGVTVSDDLEWIKHIDVITSKANSKLSFLRRNLKGCPEKLRETTYFSLVRSFLEYSATVWHPRQKYNSDKLEMVQRRAARFVKGRYGMFESVTQMLEQLTWTPLSKRRENSRLILFYKLSTIWLWYHIHVWKRLMCVPGKNILKSSATSVTTLTHMDNRSFLTVLVRGMALLKTLQRPTL